MFNQQFWDRHFQQVFAPHLALLVEVLERRLLPAFERINEEADEIASSEWERLMHLPG